MVPQNGKYRMVIDFIMLNAHTRPFHWEPHVLSDVLFWIFKTSFTLISSFDMKSAYHQIENEPEILPYCGVGTPFGTFRSRRMEFGHAQAPATLAKAIYLTFVSIMWDSMAAYFDDLYSKGHSAFLALKALAKALALLESAGLKISLDKSSWLMKEILALGFKVNADGITPDPRKAAVFSSWPQPEDAAALLSYLGSAGYLRNLIPHYSSYAVPLYRLIEPCSRAFHALQRKRALAKGPAPATNGDELDSRTQLTSADYVLSTSTATTKPLNAEDGTLLELEALTNFKSKDKKFRRGQREFFAKFKLTWTDSALAAFHALNKTISSGLFLGAFNPERPIIVETDASDEDVGGVCLQLRSDGTMVPLQFYSRKLQEPERVYSVVEKEAIAARDARIAFADYIKDRPFTHVMDQRALTYVTTPKSQNSRLLTIINDLRAEQLATVVHRPGHLHTVDGITRIRPRALNATLNWKALNEQRLDAEVGANDDVPPAELSDFLRRRKEELNNDPSFHSREFFTLQEKTLPAEFGQVSSVICDLFDSAQPDSASFVIRALLARTFDALSLCCDPTIVESPLVVAPVETRSRTQAMTRASLKEAARRANRAVLSNQSDRPADAPALPEHPQGNVNQDTFIVRRSPLLRPVDIIHQTNAPLSSETSQSSPAGTTDDSSHSLDNDQSADRVPQAVLPALSHVSNATSSFPLSCARRRTLVRRTRSNAPCEMFLPSVTLIRVHSTTRGASLISMASMLIESPFTIWMSGEFTYPTLVEHVWAKPFMMTLATMRGYERTLLSLGTSGFPASAHIITNMLLIASYVSKSRQNEAMVPEPCFPNRSHRRGGGNGSWTFFHRCLPLREASMLSWRSWTLCLASSY
jgi:hypothetical protein